MPENRAGEAPPARFPGSAASTGSSRISGLATAAFREPSRRGILAAMNKCLPPADVGTKG
jgi:hypothetical protein